MAKDELLEARRTESIIGAFYEVYNRLGYGFKEKAYSKALTIELRHRGHHVEREFIVISTIAASLSIDSVGISSSTGV